MITRFGMGQSLGQVAYEDEPHRFLGNAPMPGMLERRYSEATAERIDEAVRELIEVAFGKAASLLRERREVLDKHAEARSEEHTSELQSLMRISYAVFCLQNKTTHTQAQRI